MAVTRLLLLFCLFFVCSKSEETNSTEVELSKKADGAPTSVNSRFFDLGGIFSQLFPGFNQGNQGGSAGNPPGMDFPANSQFYPTFPIQGQNPQVPTGQNPQMPIGQGTWPVIDDAKQYPNLAQTGPQQPQLNNPGNFGGFPQPQYPGPVNGGGSPQMQYPPNQGGFGSQYPNQGSQYPGNIGQPIQNGQFPNQGSMNQFPQNQNPGNMYTRPIYPNLPGNLGNTGPQLFPQDRDEINNGGSLQNQYPNSGGFLNQRPNSRPGRGGDLDGLVPPQDPWNSDMPNNFSLTPGIPGGQQPGSYPPGNPAILGNPVAVPLTTTEAGQIFYPSSTESAAKKQCVQDCQTSTEYNPVCGSDNVTYINPGKFVCARNCGVGPSSTSGTKVVTRKYLFDQIQKQNFPSLSEKLDFYENQLLVRYGGTEDDKKCLKQRFSYVKSQIKQRWLKSNKHEEVFLKNNQSWLEGTFEIPIESPSPQGRPPKSFRDLSERSKRRKTEDVRATLDDDVIVHAAQSVLQTKGHRDASKVLKEITSSPTRASKYRKAYSKVNDDEVIPPLTPLQALQMFVDADLTRRQYEIIRATNTKHYPCYDLLLKAKQECYPPKESLRVTATCAESDLQCLMDVTVTRLSEFIEEVLITLNEEERKSLMIICKWGCDGSQQSKFKQSFNNDTDSDGNIFLSSFVPLRIVCGKEGNKIVWQNPTPSSSRFCRPIRFRYLKESTDVTNDEISYVQDSAKLLNNTKVTLQDKEFEFGHILKLTMVDGKVCNAATDTKSTSKCYICGATSKDFNDLSKRNEVSPRALEFGLSVLHARIRLFEHIIHLAYKLPVKKYRQKKTDTEKALEAQRKSEIQERFRIETGLLIDMPKANFGNTNDGNTSRRFFENPELASEITGISFELIYRFKVILETISSGHEINVTKYDQYAFDTAKLYVQLYGWHPMSPTLHKILIHGGQIIQKSLLPIGQLSEEAAEARNKHFRSYRLNFARKFSREECNLDIYNRLLLSSDPLISCMRQLKKPSHKAFLPETIDLLISAEPNRAPLEECSESEDDLI